MAEYIEREAVLKIIADNCPHDKCGYNTEEEMGAGAACYYIIKDVDNIPAADVVPKSEVDDLKRYIILNEDIAIKCKRENGVQNEEYWKGKISAFKQIRAYIDAELKNKYTESESVLGEYKFDEKIHTGPLDLSDAKFIDEDGNVTTPADWQDWNETPPWEESEDKE